MERIANLMEGLALMVGFYGVLIVRENKTVGLLLMMIMGLMMAIGIMKEGEER